MNYPIWDVDWLAELREGTSTLAPDFRAGHAQPPTITSQRLRSPRPWVPLANSSVNDRRTAFHCGRLPDDTTGAR